MKFLTALLLLVCSVAAFGQRDTVLDSEGHPSKAILIASHAPLSALARRDVMIAPGTWAVAPLPPKINPRATGSTYMALGDIHKVYESVFNIGGCATFSVFNGSIDWNACTFQVRLVTFLDKPLSDGTVEGKPAPASLRAALKLVPTKKRVAKPEPRPYLLRP
jgi:hypothetical protein